MHRLLGLLGATAFFAAAFVGCNDETDTNTETGAPTGTTAGTTTGTGSGTTPAGTETGTGSGTGAGSGGAGGGTPSGSTTNYPTPVAYWTLDTADISGNTVVDTIGDADGQNDGASADASGQVGQALAFDGVNDFIDFGDVLESATAGADTQFSVSMWIKPAVVLSGNYLLAKLGDTSCNPNDHNRQWAVQIADTPRFTYYGSLASPLVAQSGTGTITPNTVGQWYHLVFTYDGTVDTAGIDRLAIYVDGVADTLTNTIDQGVFPSDIPDDGAAHMAFGIRMDWNGIPCDQSGSTFFNGSLDELAIFDAVLSQDDVDAVRSRGQAGQSL